MEEALTRILGLKARMGLNKKAKEELCPSGDDLQTILHNPEYKAHSPKISRDAITLVKSLDKDVLPLSPEKTKRIMIVSIKGADNPLMALAAMAMGGGMQRKTPAEKLCERLNARGFETFIYESPLDKMKAMIARGEKPSINIYFAGKNAIADFRQQQDLIISLFDVANGRPAFGLSKGGGEIPWYVHELPVVGISVNKPTILADCPMLRTYINAYDSNDDTMDALVDALLTGDFRGKDPIDSFCGMWDTRI
jgi:beta-N-acetylhexosaminidase